MAIISAGVIMNVILALGCFVFVYMTHGDERMPAFIDRVDPGSPIWQSFGKTPDGTWRGAHRGDSIRQIGNRTAQPPTPFVYFDKDLQPTVMLSTGNEELAFVFGQPKAPEGEWVNTTIEPRLSSEQGDEKPVIGLRPTNELKLFPKREARTKRPPVLYQSAASRATDPKSKEPIDFQFGDEIIGTSTLGKPNEVTMLPLDPTDIHQKKYDYFEFQRRMKEMAGKPVIIRVRRAVTGELDDPNAQIVTVDLEVPPAYRYVLGMRMQMGAVTAVRPPAKDAGIKPGDVIEAVEIIDAAGKRISFGSTKETPPDAKVEELDPDLLPYQLEKWAKDMPADKRTVTFRVMRKNLMPPEGKAEAEDHQAIKVDWDDSWAFNSETPIGFSSPLSLSCLGIAYRVMTTVRGVAPDGAAATAEVEQPGTFEYHDGDLIKILVQPGDVVERDGKTLELKEDELFLLKPGDEVTRAIEKPTAWWKFWASKVTEPVTFTVGKSAMIQVKKGDQINLRPGDVITEVQQYAVEFDRKTGDVSTRADEGNRAEGGVQMGVHPGGSAAGE